MQEGLFLLFMKQPNVKVVVIFNVPYMFVRKIPRHRRELMKYCTLTFFIYIIINKPKAGRSGDRQLFIQDELYKIYTHRCTSFCHIF